MSNVEEMEEDGYAVMTKKDSRNVRRCCNKGEDDKKECAAIKQVELRWNETKEYGHEPDSYNRSQCFH